MDVGNETPMTPRLLRSILCSVCCSIFHTNKKTQTTTRMNFDGVQVNRLMPMNKCIEIMENMFRLLANNQDDKYFSFPVRSVLPVPTQFVGSEKKVSVLGFMPSFARLTASDMPGLNLEQNSFISTKVITVYIPNEETHLGLILLFEAETGSLLAKFDAKSVTGLRTAACSAVAAKNLVKEQSSMKVALVGSGEQARMHALALAFAFPKSNIHFTVAGRSEHNLVECVTDIQIIFDRYTFRNCTVDYSTDLKVATANASIICTLTSSPTPVLKREWVPDKTLVIAVGACKPNMRELESEVIRDSVLIVDQQQSALKEAGDILIPINEGMITKDHIFAELSEIVDKRKQIPETESGVIVFKSLGLAIEDLVTCVQILSESKTLSVGSPVHFPELSHIQKAQKIIESISVRTPLLPLNDSTYSNVYLKLENLQPIGSYKIRAAANAILELKQSNSELFEKIKQNGVVTCSAGNFAQGVAFVCKKLDLPCTIVVPTHAPEAKRSAILRINSGVTLKSMEMSEYWDSLVNERVAGSEECVFISPVTNPYCMAGNGTIALEILEQIPATVDTNELAVLVPYGGGAMTLGICIAMKSINPNIQVYAVEVETACPLKASLDAGEPTEVNFQPSFVDGIGSKAVFPSNFNRLKGMVNGSLVVSLKEVSQAIKHLVERNHIVAEGAGAASVAAAIRYNQAELKNKTIVSVVSGGNIDACKLVQILNNEL